MRSRVLSSRFRERVLVSTKTGMTYSGILYSADKTVLVLKQTEALGVGENKADVAVDGELMIFLDNVDVIQRP